MAKRTPIKVGVIGLGRAGWDIHIRRMRGDERFQVVAVTDWLPDRLAEAQAEFGCATYPDHKALLKATDAEVVVVATYSSTHPSVTKDVLRSGRHAICEKPMADSVAAAKSMLDAEAKSGKTLFMHHNYRFFPETRHLLDIINSRRIGEVFEIRMRAFSFDRRYDWQTFQKFDGGVLNNTCPHFLDIGLRLLDSPVAQLFCDLKHIIHVGDAEDHVKIVMKAENGRVYDMEVSSACKFAEPKWTVLGTHGTLLSDGSTSKIISFDPKKQPKLKPIETPLPGRKYCEEGEFGWQTEEVPSVGPAIGDFYDNLWAVLREGKKRVVVPEEALEVVKVTQWAKRGSGFYS